nr:MAG TPA: hypothetical protein [Caudoviricetes sp.]
MSPKIYCTYIATLHIYLSFQMSDRPAAIRYLSISKIRKRN